MNRGDLAGRETIGVGRTIRIMPELLLAKIEDIDPTISGAHPQQTGPIAVNRNNAVIAETVWIGGIVLKDARHTFRAPVKVMRARGSTAPRSHSPHHREVCCCPVSSAPAPSGYSVNRSACLSYLISPTIGEKANIQKSPARLRTAYIAERRSIVARGRVICPV